MTTATATAPMSEDTDLIVTAEPIATSVIAGHELLKAQIAAIAVEDKAKTFDYRTENALARSHVYKIRKVKATVEAKRKESKAEAVAFGKRVDAAAAAMALELEELITPHQKALDDIEAEDQKRKAAHLAVIDRIIEARQTAKGMSSNFIAGMLAHAKRIDTKALEEFAGRAQVELATTIMVLEGEHERAQAADAAAAELANLRAEAAERAEKDRQEAARQAAELAEQRRIAAAEQARRQAGEDARIREAAKALAEAAEAQRLAEWKAEQAKAEQANAERKVKLAEERAAAAEKKAKDDEEAAQAEAERRENEAVETERLRLVHAAAEAERMAKTKAEAEAREIADAASRLARQEQTLREIADDISAAMEGDGGPAQIADAIMGGKIRHVRMEG